MADDNSKQPQPLETSWTAHIAALTFVMLLPTVTTLLYFVVLSGSPWMKRVYFGSNVVQLAFPLVWVVAVQRQKLHLARPALQSIMPGLLMGILVVAVGLSAYFGYLKSSLYLKNAPELISQKSPTWVSAARRCTSFSPSSWQSRIHCWKNTTGGGSFSGSFAE